MPPPGELTKAGANRWAFLHKHRHQMILPASRQFIPFLWQNGTMEDLGSLGGTLSIPGSLDHFGGIRAVNESGKVAGTSTLAGDEVWHAFVWSNGGTMIDLGTLGGSTSDALAIENQVVGRADFSPDRSVSPRRNVV